MAIKVSAVRFACECATITSKWRIINAQYGSRTGSVTPTGSNFRTLQVIGEVDGKIIERRRILSV
jgi:hypothetical protein